jgi:hypothetical protein
MMAIRAMPQTDAPMAALAPVDKPDDDFSSSLAVGV